jgi:Tat protein translocase TatB subunit
VGEINLNHKRLNSKSAISKRSQSFGINICFSDRNNHKINQRGFNKSQTQVFGPGGGFLGVGSSELLVIGIVAWLVLGPKRLYQLAKDIGKITSEVKNVAEEARQTFQQAIDVETVNQVDKNETATDGVSTKVKNKKKAAKIDIDEMFDNETKNL